MNNIRITIIILVLIICFVGVSLFSDLSGDGMNAIQDIRSGTNPLSIDSDNDNLSDYQEIEIYDTDPLNNDSDSDRISDYIEVKVHKTDPLEVDTDDDNLSDYEEITIYETDPLEIDTDDDNLSDYEEITIYETDPLEIDTDDDNLSDYEEIKEHNTNPNDPDSNNDRLSDYEEVKIYNTNPLYNDTDADGLSDYEEVKVYNTNPTEKDSDNDNITDLKEIKVYNTNPISNDTDNDNLSDRKEIRTYNTNPKDPDTSNNNLSDGKSVELGLDPTVWDSSGDGLPNGYKYRSESLDLERMNIVVELDKSSSTSYVDDFNDVIETFDSAPVESKLGKKGINLLIIENNRTITSKENVSFSNYLNSIYEERNYKNRGSYHGLVSYNVNYTRNMSINTSDVNGVTSRNISGFIFEYNQSNNDKVAATFMHELGHQLGLWPSVFDGIDSSKYSRSEYPSVMNYNPPNCSYYEYKDNKCRNKTRLEYTDEEWVYISKNLPRSTPDYNIED